MAWVRSARFVLVCLSCVVLPGVFAAVDLEALKSDIAATWRCHKTSNPGLAVSIVKDGEVVFAEGFGEADIKEKTPVTNETLFGVASLSKAFAATLLLKLISRRSDITLSTRVVDILGDEFAFPDEFRTKYTTLEDILSHRTGLRPFNSIRFDTNLTRANLASRIRYLGSTGTWRSSYIYNNLMYGLVTRIAEVVGGDTWENLIEKELYNPLQMTSSSFSTTLDFSQNQVAKPYVVKDGSPAPVSVDFSRRWGLLCGSGCVVTNALDAANWMKFHLSKGLDPSGRRVMDEKDVEELYGPRTAMRSYTLKYFNKPDIPVTSVFGMYAFGFRIGYYRGYKMVAHSGSTFGYRALLTLFPSENLGIFIAMTGEDSNYRYRFPLQNYIADRILGEKPWLNVSTICSFPAPWFNETSSSPSYNMAKTLSHDRKQYEGIYHHKGFGNLEIYYNDTDQQLMAKYGFATWLLYEQDGNNFYGKGFGIMEPKNCNSMIFKMGEDSQFDEVEAVCFESGLPPVFLRDGVVTSGGVIAVHMWSLQPCVVLLSIFLVLLRR
ncbi:uncharacterized protein LOC124275727 [Haliotis rubra]|uniref:uncharacterized protein LOC124275727 n=1 Tax=Haliotis rubra TaxID=36100 RepID=UPI001EE526E8|nr:uncharacterized protein LOC124275727 [Haliotis rubra]